MDHDDVADLVAYWRYDPPRGLIERQKTNADEPPHEMPTPEQLQRMLESFNNQARSRVPRL